MPRPPTRPHREAHPGALFLSDVVAMNVRTNRARRELSQRELAERMTALGHTWSQAKASELERGERAILVDELAALALALGVTVPALLMPDDGVELDYGHPEAAMNAEVARAWLRGDDGAIEVTAHEPRLSFRVPPGLAFRGRKGKS